MAITGTLGTGQFSNWKNAAQGPWDINGARYAVVLNGNPGTVTVKKSTDYGATWTGVATSVLNGSTVAGYVRGTTLHLAVGVGTLVYYYTFDATTDTLSGAVTAVASGGAANGSSGFIHVGIGVNSSGTIVILYSGATRSVMGVPYRSAYIARNTGGGWTSGWIPHANDAVHYDPVSVAVDSSGRFLIVARSLANGASFPSVWTIVVAADGSFSAGNAQTLGSAQGVNQGYMIGAAGVGNGSLAIPWKGSTGLLVLHHASEAAVPSWSGTSFTVGTTVPESSAANSSVLLYDGTNWHAVWINDAQTAIYHDTSSNVTTWGTDTTLRARPSNVVQSAAAGVTGDGGTGSTRLAQSVVSDGESFQTLFVPMGKTGTPSDLWYFDIVSNLEDTTPLASVEINPSGIAASVTWRAFTLSAPVTVSAGNTFYIRFRRAGSPDGSNFLTWGYGLTNGYANGQGLARVSGTWGNAAGNANWDFAFAIETYQQFSAGIIDNGSGPDLAIIYDDNGIERYWGPDATSIIPVSLSDSGTVGSSETYAAERVTTVTDTDTVSETPTYAAQRVTTITDSGTVGVSESFNTVISVTLSVSDSGTVTETPTYAAVRTLATTDSGTVTSTDAYAESTTDTFTDTGTVGVTDTLSPSATMTIADADTVSITEQFDVLTNATLSISDSGTVSETPTYAAVRTQTSTDSGTISRTETYAASRTTAISDVGTVSETPTYASTATLTPTDTGTIGRTEQYEELVSAAVTLSDSGTISVQENVAVVAITTTRTDTGTIGSTDTLTSSGTLTVSDSSTVSALESSSQTGTLSSADSDTIVAEATYEELVFVLVTGSDSGTATADETASLIAIRSDEDSGTITPAENVTAISVMALADADTVSIAEDFFAENLIDELTLDVDDSGTITGVDTLATATTLTPSDSALVAAESDISFFVTPDTYEDLSGLVGASESFTAVSLANISDVGTITDTPTYAAIALLTTSDEPTLTTDEMVAMIATASFADSDTITVDEEMTAEAPRAFSDDVHISTTDAFAVAATVPVTDSDTVSETPTFAITTARTVTDSDTITVVDTAVVETLDSVLSLSDSDTITASEQYESLDAEFVTYTDDDTVSETSLVATQTTQAISDSATVGATETLVPTIFVTLTDTGTVTSTDALTSVESETYVDSDTLTASESFAVQSTMAVTDTDTMSVTESVATFAQLTTDETLPLVTSETILVSIAVTFADTGTLGDVVTWDQLSVATFGDVLSLDVATSTSTSAIAAINDEILLGTDESFTYAADELEAFTDLLHISALQEIEIVTHLVIIPAPLYAETATLTRVDSFPFLRDAVLKDVLKPVEALPFLRDSVIKDVMWRHANTPLLLKRGTIRRKR